MEQEEATDDSSPLLSRDVDSPRQTRGTIRSPAELLESTYLIADYRDDVSVPHCMTGERPRGWKMLREQIRPGAGDAPPTAGHAGGTSSALAAATEAAPPLAVPLLRLVSPSLSHRKCLAVALSLSRFGG